jgi:spore germination protein KC
MRKKGISMLVILLFPFFLGGCWDVRYLDELSLVFAIGIDLIENKEDIKVTVQVVNPTEVSTGAVKGGGGGGSPVTTYSETGKTLMEAVRKMAAKTSRELYFSHNQVLVIGEDLARKGVTHLFDFIERDPVLRTGFYVLVAKGAKAADVLQITTPIEKIPGVEIHDAVDNTERNLGTNFNVPMRDIIERINSEKRELIMGSVQIIGDVKKGGSSKNTEKTNPETTLKLGGMAVFKNERLLDILSSKESKGLGLILNKINDTYVQLPCKNKGSATIDIMHSATSMKAKFDQGQPSIHIHVRQEANIGEVTCTDLDILNKKTFNQLERATETEIKKEILNTVDKAQQMNLDIFGFADAVYRANPTYWKKNKNKWDQTFTKIPVHVDVNTEIRRAGVRSKPYFRKIQRD